MATRYYDAEFEPTLLAALKKRDKLGRANFAQLIPLPYNISEKAESLETKFQAERKANPLLETTPLDAWVAAEIVLWIQQIRSNVDVSEELLTEAVQRYLQREVRPRTAATSDDEQPLSTTVEPYIEPVRKLMMKVLDHTRSLRAALCLPRGVRFVSHFRKAQRPVRRREDIIFKGIRERRSNQEIAAELDRGGIKPKNFSSFKQMLHLSPENFYTMKSQVKRKYAPLKTT